MFKIDTSEIEETTLEELDYKSKQLKNSFEKNIGKLDINTLDLIEIKDFELDVIEGMAAAVYKFVENIPVLNFLKAELEIELVDIEFLQDCMDNLRTIKIVTGDVANKASRLSSSKKFNEFNEEEKQEEILSLKLLDELVSKAIPFFEYCNKIDVLACQDLSKKEYLEIASSYNKKMVKALKDVAEFNYHSIDNVLSKYAKETYLKELLDVLTKICDKLDVKNLKVEEVVEKPSMKVAEIKKTDAEIEREYYINKANDMYDQLCNDWVVDLKAQAPYSVKEKCEMFYNKLNRFNETFKMPLAKNTTVGKAKEVCNQVNNLMNSISEISSESYSIGMFQE